LPREEVINYRNSRPLPRPGLAHFALDMLALPASNAECERVFSSSKLLITSVRNRLNPDLVEINECLKAWFSKESKKKRELEKNEGSSGGDYVLEASWEGEGSESSDETGDESDGNIYNSGEESEADEEDELD
jgi:hAT family C-terminal dimerisation region